MGSDADSSAALRELLHEVRTPLLALAAALDVAPPSPEIVMASTALGHLHELLRRAEDHAAGSAATELVTVSLRDTTAEVAALVAPVLAARGVGLRVELSADRVLGDPLALRQILVNLISNAARFAPPRSDVVLASAATAAGVAVEVRDQGPGIAPADAEWIFGRGNSAAPAGTGHQGIGLFLARQLAQTMQATLLLGEAGPGACFRLELTAAG